MNKKNVFFLMCFTSLFLFSSCTKRNEEIVFHDADPLSLAADVEWAVVNDPFVIFRKDKDYNSEEITHGKKGDVLKIEGYFYSDGKKEWIKTQNGFIPCSSVKIYSNKYQAEAFSRKVSDK